MKKIILSFLLFAAVIAVNAQDYHAFAVPGALTRENTKEALIQLFTEGSEVNSFWRKESEVSHSLMRQKIGTQILKAMEVENASSTEVVEFLKTATIQWAETSVKAFYVNGRKSGYAIGTKYGSWVPYKRERCDIGSIGGYPIIDRVCGNNVETPDNEVGFADVDEAPPAEMQKGSAIKNENYQINISKNDGEADKNYALTLIMAQHQANSHALDVMGMQKNTTEMVIKHESAAQFFGRPQEQYQSQGTVLYGQSPAPQQQQQQMFVQQPMQQPQTVFVQQKVPFGQTFGGQLIVHTVGTTLGTLGAKALWPDKYNVNNNYYFSDGSNSNYREVQANAPAGGLNIIDHPFNWDGQPYFHFPR